MKSLGPQEYRRHDYHAPRTWKEANNSDLYIDEEQAETSWLWWFISVACFVFILFIAMVWWGN